jgi:outer membrane protein OmpA-like peptidoglycan-associated protein
MRKWCAILAATAFLALPGFAQQKNDSSDVNAAAATSTSADTAAPASAPSVAPAKSYSFSPPAVPKATPFPGPAPAPTDSTPPGRLVPKFEIAGSYDYVNFNPGDPFASFGANGGSGEFAYNASRWLGLVADLGQYSFARNEFPLTGVTSNVSGGFSSFLFGPRLNLRKFNYFVPFVEFLVGGVHADASINGDASQYAFALAAGGGVDMTITRHFAWRVAQIDYLMTTFSGSAVGATSRQNNLRVGTGLVYRWGFPNPPPPPNHPPIAACSATPTSVFAGSGDTVAVHVNASDPDNDPLSYSYTATGGTVDGTGADVRWSSTGLAVGTYTVNTKVDDGKGGTATCSADITVAQKPNQPPTISCSTDRSPILPGERTGITSVASDPDGDPLTYSYAPSGGQIAGTGAKVQFDSTGLAAGSYTVKCSVSDGRGGTADASTNVDVQQPPPPPQATKVGDCGYTKPGASRFDNACKRVGDDVALRLKNDPNAKLVIVGFADPKEPKSAKLAQERADLAKKYLGEKNIDASRITTRTGSASTEKGSEKDNRRVDFVIVPEGATY